MVPIAGDAQVILEWSASSDPSVDYYIVFMDGVEARRVTATNATVDHLVNGRTYSFQVAAHNVFGNGPNSTMFTVSPTLGSGTLRVTITASENNSYNNTRSVTVKWTVMGDALLQKTEINSNGGSWTSVSGTSFVLTRLADGNCTVNVRATDVNGRAYTASVNITVDTVAPSIVIFSPNGMQESTWAVITVTFSKSMDRNAVIITVSGASGTILGTIIWNGTTATFTPTNPLLGDASYVVIVTGRDLAGNSLLTTQELFKTAKVGTLFGLAQAGVRVKVEAQLFATRLEKVGGSFPSFAAEASP